MFRIAKNVEVEGIKETLRQVAKVDKLAVKALRDELKTALQPTAKQIASKVPTKSPMSGFERGRVRWTGARATVNFTPGTIRRGSDVHPLVSITLTGKGKGKAFDLIEVVGSDNLAQRSSPRTKPANRYGKTYTRRNPKSRSQTFNANLNERAPWKYSAGRYGFGYFLREKKDIQKIATKILENHQKKLTKLAQRAN